MDDLRAALLAALNVVPPRGADVWTTPPPWNQALALTGDRYAEAIELAIDLLDTKSSPANARRNAVPFLALLLMRTQPAPTAEQMFDAAAAGKPVRQFGLLEKTMDHLLSDPDTDVRVAAAVELVKLASDPELASLRGRLGSVSDDMRSRRGDSPDIQHALARIGGAHDTLQWLMDVVGGDPGAATWLEQVQASAGPLPPDIGQLIAALAVDPPAETSRYLPSLFARVEAVAAAHDPVVTPLGNTTTYDPDTVLAADILRLYLSTCGPRGAAGAVEMLRAASPAMARALIELGVPTTDAGARLLISVVDGTDMDQAVFDDALAALAILARRDGDGAQLATAALQRLRLEDSELDARIEQFVARLTS